MAAASILFAGNDRRSHRARLAGIALQTTLPEPLSQPTAPRCLWDRSRFRRLSLWLGERPLVHRFLLVRDVVPDAITPGPLHRDGGSRSSDVLRAARPAPDASLAMARFRNSPALCHPSSARSGPVDGWPIDLNPVRDDVTQGSGDARRQFRRARD